MEHRVIEDIDPFPHPADATEGGRELTNALGASDVALNHYTLAPGDATDGGYHTHLDQEEVFYVLDGAVTFETEEGSVTVETGEIIRFAPGEYHHGENQSAAPATVLAIGAPGRRHDWSQIRVPVPCPDCEGVDALGVVFDPADEDDEGALRCPGCERTISV
jgi:uncharacterized cupin superfamily protein